MTPEQQQIVFYGVEAVALLFGLYGLYELGAYLHKRLKAGTLVLARAQTYFSIPALLVAFLPFAILMIFIRVQTGDSARIFDTAQSNTIFTMFGLLFLGFILQGLAIGVFWYATRSFKK